ncbi:MAG: hypothetical protein XD79_0699 [Atribacteria bacterium 34_128]|jgi:hypothetical protein|nr:MAG: hypothetical protein XD79_0699 [Atribacteria bacterium 34_128]
MREKAFEKECRKNPNLHRLKTERKDKKIMNRENVNNIYIYQLDIKYIGSLWRIIKKWCCAKTLYPLQLPICTETLSSIIGITNLILLSTSGNCFLRC